MKCVRLGMVASTLIAAVPALAQEEPYPDGWQFEATPYFWAAGLSGWTRVGTQMPTGNVNASFSDVWQNLSAGAMGSFEARKGRWGLIFDAVYVRLSKTSDPLLGGALGTVRLQMTNEIFQGAAAYRVLDSPVTPVDVLAGVRYTYIDQDLSFSESGLLPSGARRSGRTSWTDGIVGIRAAYALSDKWSFVGYADAGAGGTKYSWQVIASANYAISKTFNAKAGYRIISMNYEQPQFLYDMKISGIFIGLGIRF